ncbi:MAG: hypothetical protein QF464_09260, partial [Myxococcota bacterium]|nr:hypothetical protein [Myxococcota bacterium]
MNRFNLSAAIIALALWAGCSTEPPPSAPAAPQKAGDSATATPPTPSGPTPLVAGNAVLAGELADDMVPRALLERASALMDWGVQQPPAVQTSAALTAARLQLVAIAAARGSDELGQRANPLLRRIATQPIQTAEGSPSADAATRLKEAALAILGLDASVKDVRIHREPALELAASDTIAGQAVRAAWLARCHASLRAWADLPAELQASVAIPSSGRMLCPRCADAHHITPDKVVSLLLGEGNAGGMICAQAIKAGARATSPREQNGAVSLCESVWSPETSADPALFWGTNLLVIGLLQTAHGLIQAPVPDGPLRSLLTSRVEAVRAQLSRPWVLPTALVTAPDRADDATEPIVFIPGLGGAGLSTHHAPIGVVSLGPDGLRVGLRPTVAFEDNTLVSLSIQHGLPAGGRLVLSLEDLRGAARQPKGAVDPISSAVNELKLAAAKVAKDLGRSGDGATGVTLALDAGSAASDATRVLDALRTSGVEVVHVLKSASHGHTLPLMVREEVAGTRTVLNTGRIAYERPIIAVVTGTHIDVWAPQGSSGDAT